MSWPMSQDYNEAIQHPSHCFGDRELRGGEAVVNAHGIPLPRSGSFADVYEFNGASGAKWAIKCFTREVPGLQHRYGQLSKHLGQAKLPFMVDFTYYPKGMRINGSWYPILKMQWVEGRLLNEFVRRYAKKSYLLEELSLIWRRTAMRLRQAGIAHADLQHANVILARAQTGRSVVVKLVDYDGTWVPGLAGQISGESGHPAYQHPARVRDGLYVPEVDNFSNLVIYTALRAVIVGGKELWDRYDNGDNLLFRQRDLEAPSRSPLFAELLRLPDQELHKLTVALIDAARMPLEGTPRLDTLLPGLTTSDTVSEPMGRSLTRIEPAAPTDAATPKASKSGSGVWPSWLTPVKKKRP